ncbi:hypothetical protein ACHAQJ_001145 [Trichoderma viride]
MKLAVFSTKPYDKRYIEAARGAAATAATESLKNRPASADIEIIYHEFPLGEDTVALAKGAEAICAFVNDSLTGRVVEALAKQGVKAILLRCAGFNHVDLVAAEKAGIMVANVPSYSPEAVAEFAVALIQTLNRNTHRAYNRAREGNFALDGLLGRTLYGKTVGVIGTGKIGIATAKIMKGFGCRILAYDPYPSSAFEGVGEYKSLDEVLPESDIISLHCPLMDSTRRIISEEAIAKMKPGAMLINTSRGGLVDTRAVIRALKTQHLGGVALDVYEGEGSLFYDDHSGEIIHDDVLMRLMTFHNVIVTGHQAFFTQEALREIADCTLRNIDEFVVTGTCKNSLTKDLKLKRQDSLPVRSV